MPCTKFRESLADPFFCLDCKRPKDQHPQEDGTFKVQPRGPEDFDFITFVIDRSGSMTRCKDETIAGFNKYLKEQREIGPARFTLVQFDTEYEVLYDAVPISEVADRDISNYRPRGNTALLDAIGKAITVAGEKYDAMAVKPKTVIMSIITDGQENASTEYKRDQVFKLIDERKKQGWQFFFLGAEQAAITEAGNLGIAPSHTVMYSASKGGTSSSYHTLSASNRMARQGSNQGFAGAVCSTCNGVGTIFDQTTRVSVPCPKCVIIQ